MLLELRQLKIQPGQQLLGGCELATIGKYFSRKQKRKPKASQDLCQLRLGG